MHTAVHAESRKLGKSVRAVDVEPLRSLFVLNAVLAQVGMELLVGKPSAGSIVVGCVALPLKFHFSVGRVCLLCNARIYVLFFRVTNLCPAVVLFNLGRRVGIDHRNNARGCLQRNLSHHSISLTFASIKEISPSVKPYFL